MTICAPSNADLNNVTSPLRLSSCVAAIFSAAPVALSIYPESSSKRSPVLARSALTDLRSTLLKILLSTCVCSPCVIAESEVFRSPKISLSERMLPCASNTDTPSASSASAAVSVGAESDKITLRSAVPPSAPLTPLSAKMPSAVESSVVPPARFLAVPPTVKIASPSCATLVLDLDDAIAILSTSCALSSIVRPNADCASVTISDAYARSMLPAAARLSTFGSACIASFES